MRSGLRFAATAMSTSPQGLPRCRKKSRPRSSAACSTTPSRRTTIRNFEHDFGSFEHAGKTVFWKLDYYDRDRRYRSPDPTDENVTERILTVMLAQEY